MGLKGVCKLISELSPESISRKDLGAYKFKSIGIDTGILLHRFAGKDPVRNFANITIKYLSLGVRPVFIFDGPSPESKRNLIESRIKLKEKIRENMKTLLESEDFTDEKFKRLEKKLVHVTSKERSDVYNFLVSVGLDVFTSPGEAETMCVYLQREGIVDFTYSDDTDVMALGCQNVLRNFKNGKFDHIDMKTALLSLDLTISQFVDMCILSGCDYCPSVPKINNEVAYNLILKYKTIENVIDNIDEYEFPATYKERALSARSTFTDFSIFNPVKLKKNIIVSEDVKNFNLEKYIIHRLVILTSKFNKMINSKS